MPEDYCEVSDDTMVGKTFHVNIFRDQPVINRSLKTSSAYTGSRSRVRVNQKKLFLKQLIHDQLLTAPDKKSIQDEIQIALEQLNIPYYDDIKSKLVPDEQFESTTPRGERRCVICLERESNSMIEPCKHICMCVSCSRSQEDKISSYEFDCPVCRSKVTKIVRVYNV